MVRESCTGSTALRPWLEASGSGFGVTGGIDQKKYVYTFKALAGAVPVTHQQNNSQILNQVYPHHQNGKQHNKAYQHQQNGKTQTKIYQNHQNNVETQNQEKKEEPGDNIITKTIEKENGIQILTSMIDEDSNVDTIDNTDNGKDHDVINEEAITFIQDGNEENIMLEEAFNEEVIMYTQNGHELAILETFEVNDDETSLHMESNEGSDIIEEPTNVSSQETLMYVQDGHVKVNFEQAAIKNDSKEVIIQDEFDENKEESNHYENEKALLYSIQDSDPFFQDEGLDEPIYIQIPSNMSLDEIDDMVHNQDEVLLNLEPDHANDTILKFNQELSPNIDVVQSTLGPSLDVVQSTLHISQLNKDQSDLPEKFSADGGYYSVGSPHSLGSCPSPNSEHPNTGLHLLPSTELNPQPIPIPAPIVFEDRDSLDSLGDHFNNFQRIATFNDNEELEDFFFAKKSAPLQPKARKSTKERDNRKIQQLEARERETENEEMAAKIKNIERCRNYRNNRKRKLQSEETELEQLERKNWNLKSREQEFTDRIDKLRVYYLSAIKNGRFKCCN